MSLSARNPLSDQLTPARRPSSKCGRHRSNTSVSLGSIKSTISNTTNYGSLKLPSAIISSCYFRIYTSTPSIIPSQDIHPSLPSASSNTSMENMLGFCPQISLPTMSATSSYSDQMIYSIDSTQGSMSARTTRLCQARPLPKGVLSR